jgi:DNA-binding IclR family transcriptional regulator
MRPGSKFQKTVMDAVYMICAETGRAATLQEVSLRTGKAISTIHRHTENLRAQGLLARGQGLQPGDGRFGEGWRQGAAYAAREAERVLVENNAEPSLVKAVRGAMDDAQSVQGA